MLFKKSCEPWLVQKPYIIPREGLPTIPFQPLTRENIKEIDYEDVVAIYFGEIGAMGGSGEVEIVLWKNEKLYGYQTNYETGIFEKTPFEKWRENQEILFDLLPILREVNYNIFMDIPGYLIRGFSLNDFGTSFDLGFGNHLLANYMLERALMSRYYGTKMGYMYNDWRSFVAYYMQSHLGCYDTKNCETPSGVCHTYRKNPYLPSSHGQDAPLPLPKRKTAWRSNPHKAYRRFAKSKKTEKDYADFLLSLIEMSKQSHYVWMPIIKNNNYRIAERYTLWHKSYYVLYTDQQEMERGPYEWHVQISLQELLEEASRSSDSGLLINLADEHPVLFKAETIKQLTELSNKSR